MIARLRFLLAYRRRLVADRRFAREWSHELEQLRLKVLDAYRAKARLGDRWTHGLEADLLEAERILILANLGGPEALADEVVAPSQSINESR